MTELKEGVTPDVWFRARERGRDFGGSDAPFSNMGLTVRGREGEATEGATPLLVTWGLTVRGREGGATEGSTPL